MHVRRTCGKTEVFKRLNASLEDVLRGEQVSFLELYSMHPFEVLC